MIEKDKCFKGICQVSKQSCKCNMIKFLPNGILWDQQKLEYITNQKAEQSSSLVKFASFIGGIYFETLNQIVFPALRENYPDSAVNSLDDWLLKFGWNYKGLTQYDFTPDGLFVREIQKINGINTIIRSKTDLSLYNVAVKSAIVRILQNAINLSTNFNIERFNRLFSLLCVELIYSENKPSFNCRELLPKLYLKTYTNIILQIPVMHCGDKQKTIMFNDLTNIDIDKAFPYDDFILDVSLKLSKIILKI